MTPPLWQELLLPRQHDDALWELFHENSKLGRHAHVLSDEDVRQRMARLYESLAYEGYPLIHLPQPQTSVPVSVTDAIANRASTRNMIPGSLSSETLATLLHYGYGVTRRDEAQMLPRAFRAAPSGGPCTHLRFTSTAHTSLMCHLDSLTTIPSTINFAYSERATHRK